MDSSSDNPISISPLNMVPVVNVDLLLPDDIMQVSSESEHKFSDFRSGLFANSRNTLIAGGTFVHVSLATRSRNLASTYSSQGRWNEAEQLEVLDMSKKLLGAEHPDTLKEACEI